MSEDFSDLDLGLELELELEKQRDLLFVPRYIHEAGTNNVE